MKKGKFILFILVAIAMMLPSTTKALTQEEMYAELDKLPFTTINGKKYLETKIVDPDIMLENGQCIYTEEDYKARNYPENYLEEQNMTLDEWLEMMQNGCINDFYTSVIYTYLTAIGFGNDNYRYEMQVVTDNKNKANFIYRDEDDTNNWVSYEVTLSYIENPNKTELKKANNVIKQVNEEYSLHGLTIINSIYHYGIIGESAYSNDNIFKRYSSFKNLIENTTDEYRFFPYNYFGGGSPYASNYYMQVGLFKNDIMYASTYVTLKEYRLMYVDKEEKGTIFEKAEKRLGEYFNNKASVIVDDTTWTYDDDDFNRVVNQMLETKNQKYIGYYANLKIDNVDSSIIIVEVAKELLDKAIVSSIDINSGVNVKTESYDVPLDAGVKAHDVKDKKYVKDAFSKDNLVVEKAYDISLTKAHNGVLVTRIDRGIEVYMPVDGKYKHGEKLNVYYVPEDGSAKAVHQGEVVKMNDKTYVKFFTDHFSTYAVASDAVENPATFDNITNNILTALISVISLIGITIYLIKNKKARAN